MNPSFHADNGMRMRMRMMIDSCNVVCVCAVLSRNILNDAGSLALLEDPLVPDPTELKLSDSDWPSDAQSQSQSQAEEQKNGTNADTLLSLSAPAGADTLLSVSLTAPANADAVAATQTHADEM